MDRYTYTGFCSITFHTLNIVECQMVFAAFVCP